MTRVRLLNSAVIKSAYSCAILFLPLLLHCAAGSVLSLDQPGLLEGSVPVRPGPASQEPSGSLADGEGALALRALRFLRDNLPQRDATLPPTFFGRNVNLSIQARGAREWAGEVPEEIWLNYVLPYACMDEQRTQWRPLFTALFQPLVRQSVSITEATQVLNRAIWDIFEVHFEPNHTPKILSPPQVWAAGYASCTGLSIFLACALRAVGIPARVAGTASWNTKAGGNHDWVEVWDGSWSFTGPAEYTPQGLNHTWFYPQPAKQQVPNSRLHGIFATSWQRTADGHFPLAWAEDDHSVHGVDVTENYLLHGDT